MKKAGLFLLIGLTVFACGIVIGILAGRSQNHHAVTVQYVPPSGATDTQSSSDHLGYLVNINTASTDLLDTLPEIGPVLAKRIVDYRVTNGNFTAKSDLLNVEGIGYDTMIKIYDLITVGVEDENIGS